MIELKSKLRYAMPVPVKKALKFSAYSLWDAAETILGATDEALPPHRLNFVGSANFQQVGNEFFQHFKTLGQLQPNDIVLDVGCGIGRMALPISKYLTKGWYAGFDIDQRGIEWCQTHITPAHPNFRFEHVNVYNEYYNTQGTIQPAVFEFPYASNFFTFTFATSVFTHMLPGDVIHYLSEMRRVLKKDGRAMVTFFSLNQEAQQNIARGISNCQFSYRHDAVTYYSHSDIKEAEIAFDENWIKGALAKVGFKIEAIHHGKWSGRQEALSYQDIFVLTAI